MLRDTGAVLSTVPLFVLSVSCLLFTGCGALPGPARATSRVSGPFDWNLGQDSLAKAVKNDPFPEAAEVDLEI